MILTQHKTRILSIVHKNQPLLNVVSYLKNTNIQRCSNFVSKSLSSGFVDQSNLETRNDKILYNMIATKTLIIVTEEPEAVSITRDIKDSKRILLNSN